MNLTKNKYFGTSIGIYLNFFVHGMQAIIIAQNMTNFANMWGTNKAGVLGVISALGFGKFIFLTFAGKLSDKYGRKPFIYLGMFGYLIFFGGLILNSNLGLAYVIAFIGGGAQSFWDGSANAALMEIYPENSSTALVALKGFISASGILLPILVRSLTKNQLWFGWSLVIPFVIILLNCFFMINKRFPDQDLRELKENSKLSKEEIAKEEKKLSVEREFENKPMFKFEGVLLLLFAFLCMATFYTFQQSAQLYGIEVAGMSEGDAGMILSFYTAGAFIAVLFSSFIMSKGIRDIKLLYIYTLISAIDVLLIYLFPSRIILTIGGFIVGYASAGGALQMGNSILAQFFPIGKATKSSVYNLCMSVASITMPLLISRVIARNPKQIMLIILIAAVAGHVVITIATMRYKKVFGISAFSNSKKN